MKLTKIISLVVVATTLGVSGTELTSVTTAQAKAKYTLKTFPKAMQGKWYAGYLPGSWYRQFNRKTFLIGKTDGNEFSAGNKFGLKSHKLPFKGSKNYDGYFFFYATKVNGRIKLDSWVTGNKAVYYKVVTKTYKGKKIKSLQQYKSAKGKVYVQYFRTPELTKHFNY